MKLPAFIKSLIFRDNVLFSCFFLSFSVIFASENSYASPVKVEKLLETEQSWDGRNYKSYSSGKPQLTILKISVAPNSYLDWHQHPIPHAAYVIKGNITVQKKDDGDSFTVRAGETIAEVMDTLHRGYTDNEGVLMIVFYAGKKGVPLSIPNTNN